MREKSTSSGRFVEHRHHQRYIFSRIVLSPYFKDYGREKEEIGRSE